MDKTQDLNTRIRVSLRSSYRWDRNISKIPDEALIEDMAMDLTTLIQEEVEEFARTSTAYNKGKRALMKEAKEYINE